MKKITVYTKNGCPQCDMTKRVLDGEGITYEMINVEEIDEKTGNKTDKAEQAYTYVVDVLELRSMPVVVVEGQKPFTGFRPDLLSDLK